MGKVKSWECKDCINTVTKETPDGPAEYCRPMLEGRHRTEWRGNYLACLDKIKGQLQMEIQEGKMIEINLEKRTPEEQNAFMEGFFYAQQLMGQSKPRASCGARMEATHEK